MTAPSERAPEPVSVEWGLRGKHGVFLRSDRAEAERQVRSAGAGLSVVALVRLPDYDRMAKALALLATVDVDEFFREYDDNAEWWFDAMRFDHGLRADDARKEMRALQAKLRDLVETAARATTPSHPCPRCGEACVCAEWYDGDSCQHAQQVGCSDAARAMREGV